MDIENINTFSKLYDNCKKSNKTIYEVIIKHETQMGENSEYRTREQAKKSLDAMKEAIKRGLKSHELSLSKMSGDDCQRLKKYFEKNDCLLGDVIAKSMTYALATSEENLRMGTIVACPTAGSCGIVPAVIVSYSEFYEIEETQQINALLTAGAIGKLISNKMPLSGAAAGCQAECGVAGAMAAGALTQLRGGSVNQIINSCALILKNILGLTCDPVCGLVEIPCIKRNVFLSTQAFCASELAMAGVVSKIPIDEVIDAMVVTGQLMSPLLKESSGSGLAKTKTAQNMEKILEV